jgi:NAD(P)H-hydrate epimerase
VARARWPAPRIEATTFRIDLIPMKILTAAEMNQVDRLTTERFSISSAALMENAGVSGAELVSVLLPKFAAKKIVVLCGKGNNGGDGFVVARRLRNLGAAPQVFLLVPLEEMKGEAAENARRWKDTGGTLTILKSAGEWAAAKSTLGSAQIVIDALLGTGIRGTVRGMLAEAIDDVNAIAKSNPATVIAVDIPSGLPADTGVALGPAIKANATVTFTAPKIGMIQPQAAEFVGELYVRNIGSPFKLLEEVGKSRLRWIDAEEVKIFAAPRHQGGNKGDYGHALVVAGSYGKSGAAVLASWAALRAGAGLVTVATPDSILPIVAAHSPEIMTEPLAATSAGTISLKSFDNGRFKKLLDKKRALSIGPGISTNDETQLVVHKLVSDRTVPIILDADGLNAFAGRASQLKHPAGNLALTPHPGEMARLLGCSIPEVQSNRLALALKSAADWNAHIVLKGHQTIVASPDGQAYINSTGNPGMGTAGTGDVLTGILGGLTAQFGTADWPRVLAFGVYLHGLAGDIPYAEFSNAPLMATDLIRALPRAYQNFYAMTRDA